MTTAEIYLTDKRTLSGGAENKPSALMREPTFGSQSKFRFNLRTDHKIRDIARLYHELKPTLLWVDHNPSVDNKVAPTFPRPTISAACHKSCVDVFTDFIRRTSRSRQPQKALP